MTASPLRPETLPPRPRRPRLLLCAALGLAGGLGVSVRMLDGGHPLPADRQVTISRWALRDPRLAPAVVELLERARRLDARVRVTIE